MKPYYYAMGAHRKFVRNTRKLVTEIKNLSDLLNQRDQVSEEITVSAFTNISAQHREVLFTKDPAVYAADRKKKDGRVYLLVDEKGCVDVRQLFPYADHDLVSAYRRIQQELTQPGVRS